MSKSMDKLRELTGEFEQTEDIDEYGEQIVETVDQKLNEATYLIQDAQDALLQAEKHEIVAIKIADKALSTNDGKDERIKSLVAELKTSVADLKTANDEIDRMKS